MARIQRTIKGTSYQNHTTQAPTEDAQTDSQSEFDEDGRDLDTADRMRDGRMRLNMRDTREADMDARNQPRAESGDYVWRRPMSLDAPPARPGMVQRWVRAEMRTENDKLNWQSKFREGWRPRDPATVPDCESFYGSSQHMDRSVIRVGGLILMEMEEFRLKAKRHAIRQQINRQEESVAMETAKLSQEGAKQGFAPIVRTEEAQVSTGRRPRTLAD